MLTDSNFLSTLCTAVENAGVQFHPIETQINEKYKWNCNICILQIGFKINKNKLIENELTPIFE